MTVIYTTTGKHAKDNGVKCLVYGKSGSGKTRLLATAPKPLIVSAEGGTRSIMSQNLPLAVISSIEDFNNVYDKILASPQFWTIGLDSGSEIADLCLATFKKKRSDGRKAYGDNNDAIADAFRRYRDLKRHVVIIAREKYDKNEETGQFMYRPNMPGDTLTQLVPYLFDLTARLVPFTDSSDGSKMKSALRTFADEFNEAKDRSGLLQPWELPEPNTNLPSLSRLFDTIMKG